MFEVKFEGFKELAEHLRKLPEAVRKEKLYGVLRKAGEPIRARMAQLAPRSDDDPPHMADSMTISIAPKIGSTMGGRYVEADEFEAAVAIGPARKFFYAIFMEYGTVHIKRARSFARPAYDAESPNSLEIMRTELWKLIVEFNGPGSSPGTTGMGTLGGADMGDLATPEAL